MYAKKRRKQDARCLQARAATLKAATQSSTSTQLQQDEGSLGGGGGARRGALGQRGQHQGVAGGKVAG